MRLDITGRQVDITPAAFRQLIIKSLAKIERVLERRAISGSVVLTKEKYRHITELLIHARAITSSAESAREHVAVIGAEAAAKIETRRRSSSRSGRRDGTATTVPTTERDRARGGRRPAPGLARGPGTLSGQADVDRDAAMRLDSGQTRSWSFATPRANRSTILYRRKDGNLGLIEPD